uniref:NADH-ubiquinone oxidoreductase chain 4L n=1 Tax=Paraleonnates uschakovi TaxID=1922336 RepID=A0A343A8R7_9ANNE|nr:NADH dehydrogenase subunit 4L [Paraleonnates uschakovi]APG32417.1 NADH dehydrogenase subunit 4L [Paraleonnates uschakovi]
MTTTFTSVTPILVLIMLICTVMQRKHLLMALLALEGAILTLILLMISLNQAMEGMAILSTLTFGACGASIGLACMVAMARSYGNDLIGSLSINKC